MATKPPGFLQVDVDGLWAIRRCYGRDEADTFYCDPCWSEGVPVLAEAFSRAGLPAAFFLVGRDLGHPAKWQQACRLLCQGFELGNHSQSHILGLTRLSDEALAREIQLADDALRSLGARPLGFRAPGYDCNSRVLRAVAAAGYRYDASLLPTPWVPALRVADALLARRIDWKKKQFGRLADALSPRIAHRAPGIRGLWRLPVGVTPGLRLPLTASIVYPLSEPQRLGLFEGLAKNGKPVLLLLHAIDAVDCREPIIFGNRRPQLGGFAMSAKEKTKALSGVLRAFARFFSVEPAGEYVEQLNRTAP